MKKTSCILNAHSLFGRTTRMMSLALMAFPLIAGEVYAVSSANSFSSVYSILQDQKTRSGVVLDENGEPVIGANVVVKGTTHGTITDLDGKFVLDVADGAIIQVSFIGYDTQELKADKATFTFKLKTSSEMLDEVVAVGYATQKKVNLTGAVESVNVSDLVSKPVGMTSEALQGVSAGLTVTQSTGRPGSGASLRIRGIGTLGDSNPLVLIDGVEGSIDGIDPNMIENISVLKDASSSAIYGSRAANGVILITTKRSKKDQKLKVEYNLYTGWQEFTELPEFTDGYTYMTMHNEAMRNQNKKELYSEEYLAEYQANKNTDPDKYPDVDWQKFMYNKAGFQQKHSVSISGGTEKLSSRAMFMFNDQNGIVENFNYKQYNFRMNNDYRLNKYMRFQVDLGLRRSINNTPIGGDTDIFYAVNRSAPIYAAALTDGRVAANTLGGSTAYGSLFRGTSETTYNNLVGRFAAVITPFEDMNITVAYSPEYSHNSSKDFHRPVHYYSPGFDEPTYTYPQTSQLSQKETNSWKNMVSAVATYNKTIKKHEISALAGFEQIDYTNKWLSGSRDNFTFLDYSEMTSGSIENMKNDGNSGSWALRSYFGRLNYSFASKYMLEANIRYDGSSRFASNNRWGVFPSFSLGWRASEEAFLKDIDWLSNLKLRASWGQLGNQNIGGNYPYLSTVSLNGMGFIFGGEAVNGAGITTMPNSMITWETSESSNFGIDFGFFNNRLTGSFEYYIRNTKDILLKLPIPGNIGLSANYQNAGKVRNKGWDLNLTYRDKINDFSYSIGFILSDVKNEIVSLKDAGPFIGGSTIKKEGFPIDAYYGYEAEGLFRTQEEVDNHAKQIGSYGPGDIKYKDQLTIDTDGDGVFDKADGKINADDRVIIGNRIPRMNYSFNIGMNYKGFDLSIFLQGVGKRDVYLSNNSVWAFYNGGKIQTWQLDRWTESNPDASYPRLIAASSHNNFQTSDFWMYDASYLRLKNLTLGYTIPKDLLKKVHIENLRVFVTGNNLLTFDHMPKGIDPESPAGDISTYPLTSTYAVGLNLTF